MLLHELAEASQAVGATRSRTKKIAVLAEVLRRTPPDEAEIAASYLGGGLRQRRTGVGWRSLQQRPEPATLPTLTLTEVDATLESIAALAGAGSQAARAAAIDGLLGRATALEQEYLAALLVGEVRQGALDGLLLEAVAVSAGVAPDMVRRASMLAGSTTAIVTAALTGGPKALAAFDVRVGRAIRPMLASSAPTVGDAVDRVGAAGAAVAIEAKLDGIRIQVHKEGDVVRVFSRSLDDITARLPKVVEAVLAVDAETVILDGEALALDAAGRPQAFQDTASRGASLAAADVAEGVDAGSHLRPWFFDVLYLDGEPLIDRTLRERAGLLAERVPATNVIQRTVTDLPLVAASFNDHVLQQGHEGVVVKSLAAPYEAGRRGAAWVKVKPVHTLDLVVLAAEWGSGRRRGTLSNIHLGARDEETGGWVMLGKTFKGMTDAMLAWQTERFLELETGRTDYTVHVRPEQVVEIAFDGLQRSTRYPGGLALRFARVLRYRDDKVAAEADTIETTRSLARRED